MAKTALPRVYSRSLRLIAIASYAGWFAICILTLVWEPVAAQNYPPGKLLSRVAEVERELEPRLGAVRLHRVEELEDDVFIPTSGSVSVESPFLFYQVERRRFFVKNGEILQNVPAGARSQYVAISADGEQVYRLAGFPDPENNFRRLVSDYHLLAPGNRTDAESRALYCAQVVFGVEPKQWILQDKQALALATDYFFSDERQQDPFRKADHWLRSFRAKNPKTNLNLTTARTAHGSYLTRLPIFWAPVETRTTPEIRELQILVYEDGSCHRVTDSTSHSAAGHPNDDTLHKRASL